MDLEVDPQKLANTGAALVSSADGIAEDARRLQAQNARLAANWTGEARDAFVGRAGQVEADALARAASLRRAGTRVQQLAQEYADADVAGARAVLGL